MRNKIYKAVSGCFLLAAMIVGCSIDSEGWKPLIIAMVLFFIGAFTAYFIEEEGQQYGEDM